MKNYQTEYHHSLLSTLLPCYYSIKGKKKQAVPPQSIKADANQTKQKKDASGKTGGWTDEKEQKKIHSDVLSKGPMQKVLPTQSRVPNRLWWTAHTSIGIIWGVNGLDLCLCV